MYGLEKNKRERFSFDLEVELKKKPERKKQILTKVEKHMHDIKQELRETAAGKSSDQLGVILHAYTALQKVLKKISK